MDTSHSILRSARHFFAGTAFSRISGLLRDMAMAFCFGSAPEIAAFMVAYRLANLFRRLFGEGNLQAGFVPHFETLRGESPQAAFSFYRDSVFSLSVLLILAIGGIEGALAIGARHLGSGWSEIARLAMWMAPGLLFICLSSLNSALLQCQKQYFAPAAAPVIFNAVWILAVLIASPFPLGEAVRFLSIGVTLAFGAQWCATAVRVRREVKAHLDWTIRPFTQKTMHLWGSRFFSPEWRRIMGPMALGIVGVGAMQVNSTLDALFAHYADSSGPAYLWYAIRVQQLPLALFGIALSGALLPPLSRAMREGALGRYRELLSASLKAAATLMIPCAFGLFALGASGLNLLYGRGAFTSEALRETLLCLWAYGLGLVPAALVLLLATGFYATKTYGAPTLASLISVAAHCALNIFLIFGLHWGAVSVAIATSGSSWLNLGLLARGQKIDPIFWRYAAKIGSISAAAALATLVFGYWLGDGTLEICRGRPHLFTRSPVEQLLQFCGVGGAYLATCLGLAKLLGWKEVFTMHLDRDHSS